MMRSRVEDDSRVDHKVRKEWLGPRYCWGNVNTKLYRGRNRKRKTNCEGAWDNDKDSIQDKRAAHLQALLTASQMLTLATNPVLDSIACLGKPWPAYSILYKES